MIRIDDTINPGTASFIERAIDDAESDSAPLLIIELDTPGGLLSSTRQIVQKILNTPIPVVLYVTPQGAHATSAGAFLVLASDVAAMSEGTHVGAAHPVVPGNKDVGEKMDEKITSDTVAFAESIAKAKGRNTEFAAEAVKSSRSLVAKEALEKQVIDLIAADLNDLLKQLTGLKLRTPKKSLTHLPKEPLTAKRVPTPLRYKMVSFFANPELAYMIMSLGGLCIWVEVTHPGLIFPGVIGVMCVILSLISFQLLPISYGALAFLILGMALMIAEVYVSSYGLLGLGGAICFILGSLFLMDTHVPEMQISLGIILPTAALLLSVALGLSFVVFRSHRRKVQAGLESMVGEFAEVREEITPQKPGKVFLQGELWSARTQGEATLPVHAKVVVESIDHMELTVRPA